LPPRTLQKGSFFAANNDDSFADDDEIILVVEKNIQAVEKSFSLDDPSPIIAMMKPGRRLLRALLSSLL
jgi:hypothetical protein